MVVTGQPGRLLRNLILFDHFTMHTVKLRELPDFMSAFGIESTIDLFKSGALTISPDFVSFAADVSFGDQRPKPYELSLGRINSIRRYSVGQNLQDVTELMPTAISAKDRDRLFEAATAAFSDEPPPYGIEAQLQAKNDFLATPIVLKTAVALRLRQVYGLAITANDFILVMRDEGRHLRAETNLAELCRLTDKEVHSVVGMSMVAVAHLNLRLEEMKMHESVSGFQADELALFEARTRFLLERQNCEATDRQFRRIVSLLNLPEIPTSGQLNVDEFLKLRESADCADFREWLSASEEWSDREITDRVKSVRAAFARYYQGLGGKTVRLLVSTGLGVIPLVGTAAGFVISALDTFLLDKILRPSGAISFISSSYPSLFEQ